MADTIRSLSELNALLSDNTTQNISPQDIRDLMVSQMCHAEIGSGGKTQEVLAAGWNRVKLDTDGVFSRGFSTDVVNYKITGTPVEMKVIVSCELLFRGTDGADFELAVFKNPDGSPTQIARLDRTIEGSGTKRTSISWATGVQLAANDELALAVRSSGSSWKLDFGRLSVRRIGVE